MLSVNYVRIAESPRIEAISVKPFFRDAFRRTHCLIPASGYMSGRPASSPGISRSPMGEPIVEKDRTTGEVVKKSMGVSAEDYAILQAIRQALPDANSRSP